MKISDGGLITWDPPIRMTGVVTIRLLINGGTILETLKIDVEPAAADVIAAKEKAAKTAPAKVPGTQASEPDASSEKSDQGVAVFPKLPVVDDSEATLRANDIHDLKDKFAILSESVGMEGPDGSLEPFFKSGDIIPVEFSQVISTTEDGQREIEIKFVRGTGKKGAKNSAIGTVKILGLPKAAAGIPRIEVQLKIQRNGNLVVSASDKSNGKPLQVSRVTK